MIWAYVGDVVLGGSFMQRQLAALAVILASFTTVGASDIKPAPAPMAKPYECKGEVWVVRKSQIIPGGTFAGFMKAVADQTAWYRANGITTNEQRVGRAFETNSDTHERKLIEDVVVSIHINQPQTDALPRGDAKWKAFVDEFKANSKILEETDLCMAARP